MRTWLLACLLLPPLAMATTGECDPAPLAAQYAHMHRADQSMRGRYIAILEAEFRQQRFDPREKEGLETAISDIDERNQKQLSHLLALCGWPGRLDSGRAASSAFLVIQHAELDYQLKYFDLLKAAHKRGELSGRNFAMLVDRVRLRQGKGQLYGTQAEYGSGKMPQIDDPANLNRRRKAMGLPPLPASALK